MSVGSSRKEDEGLEPPQSGREAAERWRRLRSPELSSDDVARLAADADVRVRRTIASRIDLESDVLDRLLADADPDVRRVAFSNPRLTVEQYERVAPDMKAKTAQRRGRAMATQPFVAREMARSSSRRSWRAVAQHSDDSEAIGTLIAVADEEVVDLLFQRTDLPERALLPLAADHRPKVRVQAAQLASLPEAVWMSLACDDAPEVRAAVAANPSASRDALYALVDRARGVLRSRRPLEIRRAAALELRIAATNTSAPSLALQDIARTKRWDLRMLVAAHPGCGPATRRSLARDGRWPVRAAVAGCPETEQDLLLALGRDASASVRLALVGNPNAPAEVIDSILRTPCQWSADASTTSAADRTTQFSDPSPARWIRGLAAGNPNASPDALRDLTRDYLAPPWVLGSVARNPACPTELADELLTWLALGGAGPGSPTFDPRTCATNPVDQAVNAHAYFHSIGANTTPSIAARHPLWPVRQAGMVGKRVPYTVLVALGRDPADMVRSRVLTFSPLPLELLDELRLDAVPWVASAAERAYEPVKAMRYWRRPQMNGRARRRPTNRRQLVGACVVAAAVLFVLQGNWSNSSGPALRTPSSAFDVPPAATQLLRLDGARLSGAQSVTEPNGSTVSLGTADATRFVDTGVTISAGSGQAVTVVDVSLTFNGSAADGPVTVDAALPAPLTIGRNQSATFVSLLGPVAAGTSVYVRFGDNSSASFDYR